MENDKLFELMTKMYSEMQVMNKDIQETKTEMREGFSKVDARLDKLENTVTNIEHTHGQKLEALFDGYTQNKHQLDCIEQEVSHQEFVLERIK